MNHTIKIISYAKYFFVVLLFFPILSYSQKQPGIPMPRGPVDLSETSNLVIFIIIPAIIIIAFLIFRKRIKRIKKKKNERIKENIEEKNKKG
jgi:phosphotransferase system  glucose/maltose/N-acetylglucosamine-specific IIC component